MFVDDGHDLDRAAVGGGVELEVDRPDPVGCVGLGRVRCAGAQAFAAAALGHAKAFLAPEPLDLLVVDGPAVGAGVVIGGGTRAAGGPSRTGAAIAAVRHQGPLWYLSVLVAALFGSAR